MTDIRKDQSESSDISDSPHTRLVPQLRFKGFTGSWEQHKFRDIFSYRRPDHILTPDSAIYSKGKYPVLTANKAFTLGFTDNQNHVDFNVPCLIFDDFTMQAKYVNYPFSVRSSAIKVLRTNKEYDLYFAYELLSAYHFPELGHARHYISYVQSRQIYVPSLKEQKKISLFLVKLDSLIAAAERKRDLLKKQKQGYLQKLFPKNSKDRPQLRFKGFNGSWERRKLTEFVTRIKTTSSDMTLPIVEYDHLISDEGKLVSPAPLNNDSKSGTLFVPGEILFGKLRPYLKNWLFADFKGIAVGDFWVLDPNHCNPVFLYTLIQSRRFLQCANTSSGSKMPRADWNYVSNSDFYIPSSKNEQARIGHFFKTQDFLIAAAERKIRLMKKLKEGYLQKMFI